MSSLISSIIKSCSLRTILISHRFNSTSVDKLFIQGNVQEKLKKLTGFNESVVFKQKPIPTHETPRYMFMTPEDLEISQERAGKRGRKQLEMVPYLLPSQDEVDTLSFDPEIQGFEKSRIVFTDISHGANERNRLIVVREPDGTLRRANRGERYRMNQSFFPIEERSHVIPAMYEEEHLAKVLDRGDYLFILERTCLQFEPDDPMFVKVTHQVYETINEKSAFDTIKSTRFYGPMVFHLAINKTIDNLLLHYLKHDTNLDSAKELIELYNIVHGIKTDGNLNDGQLVEQYIHNQSKSHVLLSTLKSLQESMAAKDGQEEREESSANS